MVRVQEYVCQKSEIFGPSCKCGELISHGKGVKDMGMVFIKLYLGGGYG
jgi:hypothetical protein